MSFYLLGIAFNTTVYLDDVDQVTVEETDPSQDIKTDAKNVVNEYISLDPELLKFFHTRLHLGIA